jgi:hypothetical protein
MKLLLLFVVSLLTACAHTTQVEPPLRVVGKGATYEAAKQSAFRDAIELKVGSMVLSERETANFIQTRNEILVYSAGFVDDYKIINRVDGAGTVYITMDVWVSSTKLSNRLLSTNNSIQSFDASRHLAQTSTIQREREQSGKMLREVMNDYPKRAFKLEQFPYKLSVTNDNKTLLSVGYRLSYDYNWLQSVNAALLKFSDGTNPLNNFLNGAAIQSQAEAVIISKSPNAIIMGEKRHYTFTNMDNFLIFRDSFFYGNEVRISMKFYDSNHRVIHYSCWRPVFMNERSSTGEFYRFISPEGNRFAVMGNSYEDGTIKVTLSKDLLKNMRHIEIAISSVNECK